MTISPFAPILEAARTRHGAPAVEARLPRPKTAAEFGDLAAPQGTSYLRGLIQES
jgi:hypothetical protein